MSRPIRLAWMAALAVVGAATFWLVLSATTAQVLGARVPAIALSWHGANSDAQAGSAWASLQGRIRRPALERARTLASGALRRNPGNVVAIRTLAAVFAAEGQTGRAGRLFRYSESLSRRDLPTQLWLIESEVAANNISGALLHYDRALRTSTGAREILIPVLVRASADRAVARQLGKLMAHRPEWWTAAIGPIVGGTPDPSALPIFLGELHLDVDDEAERAVLVHGLRRLVEAGQFSAASRLYGQASRSPGRLLRNGDFESDRGLQPFDWDLQDDGALGARIQPREGGSQALFLVASTGRGGQVARQLLILAPGRYGLSALVGDVAGEAALRPLLSLHCAAERGGGLGTSLGELRFPVTPAAGRRVGLTFEVPARGCAAQWLSLDVSSDLNAPAASSPWLDQVALQGP